MYIVSFDNLDSEECNNLQAGAASVAKYVVEQELPEPTVTEIWLYEENKSAAQADVLNFERLLNGLIQEEREEEKVSELDFRRHGHA